MLDVFGFWRVGNWWNLRVEREPYGVAARRADGDPLRRAVQIARRAVPLLAFAAIHRQLHGMAIGTRERLVPMEQRLHGVSTRRHVREALTRIPDGLAIDDRIGFRPPIFDIDAKRLLGRRTVEDLKSGLRALIGRKHQNETAVQRLVRERRRKGDGESNPARRRILLCPDSRQSTDDENAGTNCRTAVTHAELPVEP